MKLKTFVFHLDEYDKMDVDLNGMICSYIDTLLWNGWKVLFSQIAYDEEYSAIVNQKRYKKCLTLGQGVPVNA